MSAIPLKLSAVSIGDRQFVTLTNKKIRLTQSEFFKEELQRIEWERSESTELSQLYLNSIENSFLHHILRNGADLPELQLHYPSLVKDALQRSPDTLIYIRSEWNDFSEKFFNSRGRPVPDWPLYVEIQEGLRLYGRTPYHRFGRILKKEALLKLKTLMNWICARFEDWEWAAQKRCYLEGYSLNKYKLSTGNYSC